MEHDSLRILPIHVAFCLALAMGAQASQPVPEAELVEVDLLEATGLVEVSTYARAIDIAAMQSAATWLTIDGSMTAAADYKRSTGVGIVGIETENGTMPHANGKATFVADWLGESYRMFVSPLPDALGPPAIQIATASMQATASKQASVEPFDPIEVRAAEHVNVSDTMKLGETGRTDLVVEAPFRLRLWDIAGNISTEDDTIGVFSGERFEPLAPVNGSEPVARQGEARLLVFDVREGQAILSVPAGNVRAIYAEDSDVTLDGSLRGFVGSSQDPTYASTGNLSFALAPVHGSDMVALHLAPAKAAPSSEFPPIIEDPVGGEGQPGPQVDPAASTGPDGSQSPWRVWAAWIIAAVAAGAWLGRAVRQRWLAHRFHTLKRDYMRDDFPAVVGGVRPLLRSRRHRWDAGTMAIVAAAHLGRTDEAIEVFGRVQRFAEAETEGLDYLAACIASARGETETAAEIIAGKTWPPLSDSGPEMVKSPRTAKPGYEGYA